MHELSVCQALVEQLVELARQHGAARVERAELRVGPLSGLEPPLLEAAYPVAAAGTVAEAAVIAITRSPVVVRCRECGLEGEAPANRLACPRCASVRTTLVSGDELLLARVELSGIPEESVCERAATHV
jgi:hydrogenase nickel incorporation protein HypA/HybF